MARHELKSESADETKPFFDSVGEMKTFLELQEVARKVIPAWKEVDQILQQKLVNKLRETTEEQLRSKTKPKKPPYPIEIVLLEPDDTVRPNYPYSARQMSRAANYVRKLVDKELNNACKVFQLYFKEREVKKHRLALLVHPSNPAKLFKKRSKT